MVLEVPAPLWLHGLPDTQSALMIACPGAATCTFGRANLYVVDLRDLSSDLILEQVARAWYTPIGHIVYVRSTARPLHLQRDSGDDTETAHV